VSQLEELCFAPARARCGQQAWQAAYAAGTTLDRDQTIDTALRSLDAIAAAGGADDATSLATPSPYAQSQQSQPHQPA
jgi:hypothetical protein